MQADVHALVASLRRIQELATDTPEDTLEEARKALDAIWNECDARLAVSVEQDGLFDEGEWSDDGRLTLAPAYYDNPERVHSALMVCGDADADPEEVAAWTPEQRKLAAEWALSIHAAASDNDDVVVPPRPDFIRRNEAFT